VKRNPPQPAHLTIELDEPRIARGSVDDQSVQVSVRWRQPETTPPVVATLDELPVPVDLIVLRRNDGEAELIPKSWQGIRFGEGRTLFEMARGAPGGLGLVPQVRDAIAYAERNLSAYHPDLDVYATEQRLELIWGVIERVNEIYRKLTRLEAYLEFAEPGRKAVPYIEDPQRDVMAAVTSQILGLGSRGVGEKLAIPAQESSSRKGENRAARRAVRRGSTLLEFRFGADIEG
jgi:hypothetical protein